MLLQTNYLGYLSGVLVSLLWITPSTAIRRIPNDDYFSARNLNSVNSTQYERRAAVVVDVPKTANGHLVTKPLPLTKPGEELKTRHWAGHLPAKDDGENYFFYWLFEPENVNEDTPLLIWLNGGPACSSMDGLFLENGPIQWTVVDGEYKLQQNPYSWHKAPAYTLYVDQPVGTGLSFTTNKKYPKNDHEINVDFYYFLKEFLMLHADKFVNTDTGVVSQPLYFSGESYAGHYIPTIMNHILEQNRRGSALQIPIAGAAIGNGWFDPPNQYSAAEAAFGHGLIDRAQLHAFKASEKECQQAIADGDLCPNVCFPLQDKIVNGAFGKDSKYRVSYYDIRISELKGQDRRFPRNHKVTEAYLGGWELPGYAEATIDTKVKNEVLHILHAQAATEANQQYQECTDPPYNALAGHDALGVVPDIVQVLQDPSKPRLLFFNGVEDVTCNHVGNEIALENLPWHGKEEYSRAERYAWWSSTSRQSAAGFVKEHENLSFLKCLDSGHMMPMDVPDTALDMMKIFLSGGSFQSNKQIVDMSPIQPPSSCEQCTVCPGPKEIDCPTCPWSSSNDFPSRECADEIAEAEKEAKASVLDGSSGYGNVSIAVGSMALVLLTLIYATYLIRNRNREERDAYAVVEMQVPRYRDESEL